MARSSPVDLLGKRPRAELLTMQAAADMVVECARVLDKAELNVVGEMLRGNGAFYQYEHYPPEDIHDYDSGSQFYYHAHRGLQGEHGHFHTFLRARGMPVSVKGDRLPGRLSAKHGWPRGKNAVAHLVAISMDVYGRPTGLFTVNRWVVDDTPYRASHRLPMLRNFRIDHAGPSWPVNRWISAMLVLFRPQIEALLLAQDRTIDAWQARHSHAVALEDRALDITSSTRINVKSQMALLRQALGRN